MIQLKCVHVSVSMFARVTLHMYKCVCVHECVWIEM